MVHMGTAPGFTIHATKKLLDRVKQPLAEPVEPESALGNFYATALFWKPQVALVVNERTFLPVLMPLAPATTLADRFPAALRAVLDAHGVDPRFVDAEIKAMGVGRYAKTASRSVLGVMNEYGYLGARYNENPDDPNGPNGLVSIALWLAQVPVGPLRRRHGFPDRELHALVEAELEPKPGR